MGLEIVEDLFITKRKDAKAPRRKEKNYLFSCVFAPLRLCVENDSHYFNMGIGELIPVPESMVLTLKVKWGCCTSIQ